MDRAAEGRVQLAWFSWKKGRKGEKIYRSIAFREVSHDLSEQPLPLLRGPVSMLWWPSLVLSVEGGGQDRTP